ncbi:hypothetical protein SERLA73DRAFT_161185 [Serpula lacrymans var. lacrymans S7.3]|uniref:CHAT domain-containing protein n=1 Tax=Serpula lacrymans var. lacrymans (strain S7.3) TaxID=936435 RepID=F8PZR9_SERL3|nr:hypothetical protein SERLA73DRAFT_161185 [Serpula lacrymans var. lacrymans S7.3]
MDAADTASTSFPSTECCVWLSLEVDGREVSRTSRIAGSNKVAWNETCEFNIAATSALTFFLHVCSNPKASGESSIFGKVVVESNHLITHASNNKEIVLAIEPPEQHRSTFRGDLVFEVEVLMCIIISEGVKSPGISEVKEFDIVLQSSAEQCSCSAGLDNPCEHYGRYSQSGNVQELELSIKHYSSALRMRPPQHPLRSLLLSNLAVALKNSFKHKGDLRDLDVAIELQTSALESRPPGHPLRVNALSNLANTLWVRFLRTDDFHNLDLAIEHHTSAFTLRYPGDPHLFISLNNICLALGTRFQRQGRIEDLEQLIRHYTSLVELYPPGHPQSSDPLSHLAHAHWHRYERQGNLRDLDSAIMYHGSALKLRPVGHVGRPQSLNKLGNALLSRFRKLGEDHDIGLAITYYNEALKCFPPNHPLCFDLYTNLSSAIALRYQQHGDPEDLTSAIEYNNRALTLCPPGHPHRPEVLTNLANAYIIHFRLDSNQEDLDLAIEHYSVTLALCPQGHSYRSLSLDNLAHAYHLRFTHRGDLVDLELSIAHHSEALELRPIGHPYRHDSLINLARSLISRFNEQGVKRDLDEAVEYLNSALELCPQGNPARPLVLTTLALALDTQLDQQGVVGDLDLVVEHVIDALNLQSPGDPLHVELFQTLASLYFSRFKERGDLRDMELAVENSRNAIDLCPPGHVVLFFSLYALGCALTLRFQHQGDFRDLEQAIDCITKSVNLCPPGNPKRGTCLSTLATALLIKFKRTGEIVDLKLVIQHYTDALRLCPDGHPQQPHRVGNLAAARRELFGVRGDPRDLDIAIKLFHNALDRLPQKHPSRIAPLCNVAGALHSRFKLHGETADLECMLRHLHDALDALPHGHPQLYGVYHYLSGAYIAKFSLSSSIDDRNQAFEYYELASTLSSAGSSPQFESALQWIAYAEEEDHISKLKAYITTLNLLDRFLLVTSSVPRRYMMLKEIPSSLVPDAASCAIRDGKVDTAVELLEQGRGLLWTQLARLRTPLEGLRNSNQDGQRLADEFERITILLNREDYTSPGIESSESSTLSLEEAVERYRKLWGEWDAIIDKIRLMDGFAHFLRPIPLGDLQMAAVHGPVIILNISQYSCDAILVFHKRGPLLVPLPRVTDEQVIHMSEDFTNALKMTTAVGDEKTREKKLTFLLRTLWDNIVEPIVLALKSVGDIVPIGSRIWWCPTSKLTSLPLHAAGPYRKGEKNLSQLFISSYTPTLSALIRSRRKSTIVSPGLDTPIQTFLAVGQAKPHKSTDENELQSVDAELDLVRTLVPPSLSYSQVTGDAATVDGVMNGFRANGWIHLACHGRQDFSQPFDSSFALRDKPLRLMDIIHADLENPEFAFLSACHTALGDESTPDEVIHLAAGMQFSGFRSVIGTLWAVDDKTAMHVVTEFYKNLFNEGINCTGAAKALNKAVKKVNKTEVPLDQRIVFIHIGA